MQTFTGSLRLATDPQSRVRADIEVAEERLVVRAGGDEIGNWALADLSVDPTPGGFRINADGEDLILTTGDNQAFAGLIGVDAEDVRLAENGDADTARASKPGAESTRFGRLRSRSAASWVSDDTLNPLLAYLIFGAALALLLGSVLSWGGTRLIGEGGFPWGRLFTGTAALGAAAGAYIAWREERRVLGAGIAAGAGGLALVILYLYAAEAGLGLGFVLAMMAVVPLTAAAAIGLTSRGATPGSAEPQR